MPWKKSKYKELGPRWQDYRGEYKSWQHMIDRCTKPNVRMYPWYGGRGIKVCDRWLNKEHGFINFYHDMGPRPRDEQGRPYQIDRIDNDGNYCPENCRWATIRQNERNRRDTINIYVYGEPMCVTDTCKLFKINRSTVTEKIRLKGMNPERALVETLEYKGYTLNPVKGGK